jgi:phosphoesterase RecJ-like protein
MNPVFSRAIEVIKKGRRFLVVSHVNPEGDAVGSLLGLALALKAMGKESTPYLEDKVPGVFGFLPGSFLVVHSLEGIEPVDATIAVDSAQLERLGAKFSAFRNRGVLINIDHHVTNTNYGDINIVVAGASAAGEIVYDLLKEMDLPMTKEVATNLYVAIHTDTGSFRYASATPEAFFKAGELLRAGVDPWKVATSVYENYPYKRYKLLSMALPTITLESRGRIALMHVTLDMLESVGAEKELTDGFVNFARAIEGVEVGVFLRESSNGEYKVSLRSKGVTNVSDVAALFGGGGHPHAAGFNVKGDFREAAARIVKAVEEAFGKKEEAAVRY